MFRLDIVECSELFSITSAILDTVTGRWETRIYYAAAHSFPEPFFTRSMLRLNGSWTLAQPLRTVWTSITDLDRFFKTKLANTMPKMYTNGPLIVLTGHEYAC